MGMTLTGAAAVLALAGQPDLPDTGLPETPAEAPSATGSEAPRTLEEPRRWEVLTGVRDPAQQPHYESRWLGHWKFNPTRREWSSRGFDYLLVVAPEVQTSLFNDETHANSEQDFIWKWRFREDAQSESELFFWGLNVVRIGSTNPSELARSNGLSVETIGGADRDVLWMLGNFHYQYRRKESGLYLRLGHLFTNMVYAANKYMIDDRETFINGVFNTPTGVQWSSQKSLGVYAMKEQGDFYVLGGFQDKKSDPRYPDLDSFLDGKYHYLGELGFTPGEPGSARYSITLNYSTPVGDEDDGYGMVLNAFQDIGQNWGVFGRYGRSWGEFGDFEYAGAVGLANNRPFGWASNRVAFGYLEAKPSSDQAQRNDKGFNAYWKWQLTEITDITLDVQYYFERSLAAPDDDRSVTLVAFRTRVMF